MENKLTLIKRSNPICPMCNTMELILKEEGIPFNTVDIAENEDAIEKYSISSVPVMFIETEGGTMRLNGVQPAELIKEFLD